MVRSLWKLYAGIGSIVLCCYALMPAGAPKDLVYVVVGLSCVAAIAVGTRVHTPIRRLPWVLMLVAQLSWVTGDATYRWMQDIQHTSSYPSPADAFYLAGYPVLTVAFVLLTRQRRARRDIAGLVDTATLTAGLGLLSWVFLARPTIDASSGNVLVQILGIAYPAGEILVIGLLIRLVTSRGGRSPAYFMLFGAVLLLIAADTASMSLSVWSNWNTNSYDVLWLGSYVAWGCAALHPSMASLSQPGTGAELRFTSRRLAALALASLVAPGTLAVQRLAGARIDVWGVFAGSVLLFLLVISRMNMAITQITAANADRERLQDDLTHQALHDSLTGLPNRTQAVAMIESALSRAQRRGAMTGLLFTDLDGFKAVNDSYGHRAGDEVLRTVATRMRGEIRAEDFVARLGGDEFVVLLENLNSESEALHIALRLVACAAVPILLGQGSNATIGISIGMAISQDGSTDADRLLHEADTAAYRAKSAGRGRVEVFDDALRSELTERGDLEQALARAISNDELVLHYQPIIDLATGDVGGYEALVRWQREGHGLVFPDAFIPVAEASTLICDLDAWVLVEATTQLAAWTTSPDRRQRVSVNISGRHISLPRILDDVSTALTRSGLRPDQLALEITETALLDDLFALHHLTELRRLGVSISLDDFGTGYNSFARLESLPIDVVKIDRSFLASEAPSATAVLRLMVLAAHAFGLPVIVEGVEHAHQLAELRSMNCESAQGFYFYRPLTAEDAGRTTVTSRA